MSDQSQESQVVEKQGVDQSQDHVTPSFEELQKQIETLKEQVEENLNGWKRAKADLINFKKEIEEEKKGWMAFALVGAVVKFLPLLDHLNAALDAQSGSEAGDERLNNFIQGIENTKKQFEEVLGQMGVEEVAGAGAEFDPFLHESVEKEGEVTGSGKLVIAKVMTRGYKMKDQVLRPAKVTVKEVESLKV